MERALPSTRSSTSKPDKTLCATMIPVPSASKDIKPTDEIEEEEEEEEEEEAELADACELG